MSKKRPHNWKARQVFNTTIDKSIQDKIKLDLERLPSHDDCNALVLPSAKRKTIVKRPQESVKRILSRKQRKRLEKIVETKKKKNNRASLLESLAKVQVSAEELKKMSSISDVQTKGLKRFLKSDEGQTSKHRRQSEKDDDGDEDSDDNQGSDGEDIEDVSMLDETRSGGGTNQKRTKVNSIVKANRKRRKLLGAVQSQRQEKANFLDPNIVGLESSSDEDGDEDDNDDDVIEIKEEPQDSGGEEPANDPEAEEEPVEKPPEDKLPEGGRKEEDNKTSERKQTEQQVVQEDRQKGKVETNSKEETPKTEKSNKPAVFVSVNRDPRIEAARHKLPILAEEQVIMETVNENPVVIIAGETGSGKTTQLPQFLYEAGYTLNGKLIGVTEPRRVAAISMSQRVGQELSLGSDVVSYLIRFEGNVTPRTQIKFMTDGVLLKEIQSDFLLSRYSVIILDEAHERSVYTDILVGLLSRIVPLRYKRGQPLKLVVMSATLRINDFTDNKHLFKHPPPVVKVESRQFPVTIHFNKRTNPDYLREAFRKVCRIHSQLPDGGILVFLTGQQEVNTLVNKLRKTFPMKNRAVIERRAGGGGEDKEEHKEKVEEEEELDLERAIRAANNKRKQLQIKLPQINLDSYACEPNDDTDGDLLGGDNDSCQDNNLSDDDDEEDWIDKKEGYGSAAQPLWVLPLYSLLPTHKQAKVFDAVPEGFRLCVVATNVAETSLTIPGVKYVVDTGKVKTKLYDKTTGVSTFTVLWTSKASANQRAGRAGRTGPGHCYRLYSSAVFNDEFEDWSVPEMQKRNVEDLVLQMKALGIDRVVNFPFPSPPDADQLRLAENTLTLLGAIEPPPINKRDECCGKLTALGESMACFPVAPRYAKMLCLSDQHQLMEYTVAVVAALSVQELLHLQESNDENQKRDHNRNSNTRRRWAGQGNSLLLGDVMVVLKAIGAAEYAASQGRLSAFCADNGLREKAVIEARKLRLHITNEINLNCPHLSLAVDPKMKPPTDSQAKLLRQIVAAGMVDRVARRCQAELAGSAEARAGAKKKKALYSTADLQEEVRIHSSSVLRKEAPEWVIYQEIFSSNEKLYIRGITCIEAEWLIKLGRGMCRLSEALEDPKPNYDPVGGIPRCHVTATYGRSGWDLPIAEIEFPRGLERYKWFSVFFLDGSVCPKLKKYVKSLLSTPQTMTKSWSKLQPRTEILLKTLVSKEVDSKSKLLSCWETEPLYLLSAYQKWLPESAHSEISTIWPPID